MAILDTLWYAYARARQWIEEEANFFRLHLIYFTFVPLIAAGIFYGVNGEFHIRECSVLPHEARIEDAKRSWDGLSDLRTATLNCVVGWLTFGAWFCHGVVVGHCMIDLQRSVPTS